MIPFQSLLKRLIKMCILLIVKIEVITLKESLCQQSHRFTAGTAFERDIRNLHKSAIRDDHSVTLISIQKVRIDTILGYEAIECLFDFTLSFDLLQERNRVDMLQRHIPYVVDLCRVTHLFQFCLKRIIVDQPLMQIVCKCQKSVCKQNIERDCGQTLISFAVEVPLLHFVKKCIDFSQMIIFRIEPLIGSAFDRTDHINNREIRFTKSVEPESAIVAGIIKLLYEIFRKQSVDTVHTVSLVK